VTKELWNYGTRGLDRNKDVGLVWGFSRGLFMLCHLHFRVRFFFFIISSMIPHLTSSYSFHIAMAFLIILLFKNNNTGGLESLML
jgi:hypothetical protein